MIHTHTHARTRAHKHILPAYTHTHTPIHTYTRALHVLSFPPLAQSHARTHARTHTHTSGVVFVGVWVNRHLAGCGRQSEPITRARDA